MFKIKLNIHVQILRRMVMKLPSVYANKIEKNIKNNDDYFRGDKTTKVKDLRELKAMFDGRGYANRLPVTFIMRDGRKIEDKLVLCKSDCFINLNNEKIRFDDIINYEVKR